VCIDTWNPKSHRDLWLSVISNSRLLPSNTINGRPRLQKTLASPW